MIDVHEVVRAAARGSVYQQWVDEDGLEIGFMSIQELTSDHLILMYRLFGTRNVERGTGTLRVAIRVSKGGKHWDKPSLVCPKCGRSAVRLYYVRGTWACKRSHDMLSIVQRLDSVNKAFYHREVFEAKVRAVPTSSKDRRRQDKLRDKYGAAVSLIANTHREGLPDHLTYRTHCQWLDSGEMPKTKVGRNEVGYGWVPGMAGQLPGLEPPELIRAQTPSRVAVRRAEERAAPRAQQRAAVQPRSGAAGTTSGPSPSDQMSYNSDDRAPGAEGTMAPLEGLLSPFEGIVIPELAVLIDTFGLGKELAGDEEGG